MNRWDWFMLGTIAVVPFIAYIDGFVFIGTQAKYFQYLAQCYMEAFCLVAGYVIGKGVGK